MKRSQQTVIYIFGLVLGITLTAFLLQQNILVGHSLEVRENTEVNNGFLHRTLLPFSASALEQIELKNSISFPSSNIDIRSYTRNNLIFKKDFSEDQQSSEITQIKAEVNLSKKIYVGVITAEKYLSTRAIAVNSTWGSQVNKISFFTEHGTTEEYNIPVVNLEGVSDKEYPPQKKSFKMLKYMCDNYIDEYDWFIRADDDVYIRVAKLREFLGQIDSDKLIYMGQPGHGVPEVREKLGLNGHNFCMGGPSVIFNRKAFKKLCSHLDECMTEVVSGEEDVELGRCVSNHLHIECTHAWETLKLFYHSYQEEYTEEKPFLGNLAENIHVEKAITLHHVKVPYIMYKIHRHFTSMLLNSTSQAILHLRKRYESVNELLPPTKHRVSTTVKIPQPAFKPARSLDVPAWKSFNVESIFALSLATSDRDITNDNLADLKQIGETAIDAAIDQTGPGLTYSHLSGGYFRSDPLRGTDYILDIVFSNKELGKPDEVKRVHLLRPLQSYKVTSVQTIFPLGGKVEVYLILSVSENACSSFESFMRKHFEPEILQKQHFRKYSDISVTLLVSLYNEKKSSDAEEAAQDLSVPSIYDIVSWYKVKYPHSSIEVFRSDSNEKDSTDEKFQFMDASLGGLKHITEVVHTDTDSVVYGVLTSPNVSISFDFLYHCIARTSAINIEKNITEQEASMHTAVNFYQAIPFSVFPAVSSINRKGDDKFLLTSTNRETGYWNFVEQTTSGDLSMPLCSSYHNLLVLLRNAVQTGNYDDGFPVISDLDGQKVNIFQVPDESLLNFPGR